VTDVMPICFYLPQFHPVPFNDMHWGHGFSEWTNVARGRPLFAGHEQPRLPGELGFYDLRYRPILAEQIALAQTYGVYGFCFYYYRFGEQRELHLPVRQLLSRSKPNLPFCLCWANENWTRAWDGRSDELIRNQDYSETTLTGVIDDLSEAMQDPRYIRVNGKPVFLIYQIDLVPRPVGEWTQALRERLRVRCGAECLLGAVFSPGMTRQYADFVDFVVEFPPHRIPREGQRLLLDIQSVQPFDLERKDYFEAYDSVVASSLAGLDWIGKLVPGVCPDWDNSCRRPKGAHVLIGSNPEKFSRWVSLAANIALDKAEKKEIPYPFLFVNAWNEWGEGAALEPSWTSQRRYLEAFKTGLGLSVRPKIS